MDERKGRRGIEQSEERGIELPSFFTARKPAPLLCWQGPLLLNEERGTSCLHMQCERQRDNCALRTRGPSAFGGNKDDASSPHLLCRRLRRRCCCSRCSAPAAAAGADALRHERVRLHVSVTKEKSWKGNSEEREEERRTLFFEKKNQTVASFFLVGQTKEKHK